MRVPIKPFMNIAAGGWNELAVETKQPAQHCSPEQAKTKP
jgi:hypothetical protein